MNEETLARLRRLGVVKGARQLRMSRRSSRQNDQADPLPETRPARADEPQLLEALLPALDAVNTPDGTCDVIDHVYPLNKRHGTHSLQELLEHTAAAAAQFCQDSRMKEVTFRDFLFLDTETTGLNGAGTLAFMVGVGFFDGDAFVVRQYFLRDPGDEPAMLLLLQELSQHYAGLITFNGRSFDVPLLDGRYLINRLPCDLPQRPHIDLLPPARRLWRYRFSSCSLGSLEKNLLGLKRTEEDVPGWLIPGLYHQYLQTGDGREMARVFYHNRLDILSMVTLAGRVARLFERPQDGDHPLELLGLGRWKDDLGLTLEAEQALRMAAVPEMETDHYQEALLRLGLLLKRSDRREEALIVWQQAAATSFEDVTAHIELAKHYEWQEGDLPRALAWTEQALQLTEPENARGANNSLRDELEHRRARLQRKIRRSGDHAVA